MFKRIVRVSYELPPHVDEVSSDLIRKLLVRNPASRLGNLQNGPLDVRDHPWFAGTDWKRLVKKDVATPWIPPIKEGAAVTESHFDTDTCAAYRDLKMGKPLLPEEQVIFKGF
jgi:protein kinase A